jgi:GT2 family glycosyltransferase
VTSTGSIIAILVLYNRQPAQSEALVSLHRLLAADPITASRFTLVVYDNSPEMHEDALLDIAAVRRHAPENPGLAPAYNLALEEAAARGSKWLLLLDQDTSLTEEYWRELGDLTLELVPREDVCAIVPRIRSLGTIFSPELHFLDQLRTQFPHRSHALPADSVGLQSRRVAAYNSGAALRVSALRAIGGFPNEFWLDYLDHAVFHRLQQQGNCVYVMRAQIEQQLSHYDLDRVPLWRHRSVLSAQTRFVKLYGAFTEHLLYRVWLLQMARLSFRQCRDPRVWMEKVLQALLLRTHPVRLGARERR